MSGTPFRHKLPSFGNKVTPSPDSGYQATTVSPGLPNQVKSKEIPPDTNTKTAKPGGVKTKSTFGTLFNKWRKTKNPNIVDEAAPKTVDIWLTFCFTVVVGSLLLGGGIYLIIDGSKNNVFDFILVGACSIIMGLCFSAVGLVLFAKNILLRRWAKQGTTSEDASNKPQAIESMPSYTFNGHDTEETLQDANQLSSRRPSFVELYGAGNEGTIPSRNASPASKASSVVPPPPQVAVPNNGKSAGAQNPVSHLELNESTTDDIAVISHAGMRQDISSGEFEPTKNATDILEGVGEEVQYSSTDKLAPPLQYTLEGSTNSSSEPIHAPTRHNPSPSLNELSSPRAENDR